MFLGMCPVRISFSGGGTDMPEYYNEFGGNVVTSTINHFTYVILNLRNDNLIQAFSSDFQIHNTSAILENLELKPGTEIPIAVLKHLNFKTGATVMVCSDVPPSSGLGGSSSLTVNFVKTLSTLQKLKWNSEKIAETSFHIERNVLQHPIGKQDDYIASFGGFNFIRFTNEQVYVEPIKINKSTFDELQENLLLFFIGDTRKNADILSNQLDNIKQRRKETIESLKYVQGLAEEMNSSLKQSDITLFGELLHKGWLAKKKFTKGVSNENVNKIYDIALENGASGGKLTGAGGGGHMLFYCEKSKHDRFIQKMEDIGLKHIRFKFNNDGPKVLNLYDYSGK
ncbi:MAG: D-glycero-D-manno-heptose 7-phosphate kinase [Thermoproteota archaeon]|nr:D-glycero-D-manno-heptose 7-phosphate kinase [Thermoproteota archaeon]